MTRDSTIARTARRQVEREGIAIDLKTKTEGTETEYGEAIGSTSTQTVQAVVRTPSRSRDPSFAGTADVDVDIEFHIDASVSVTGGGGILASEVDIDQDGTFEYLVETVTDLQNGLQALACSERQD